MATPATGVFNLIADEDGPTATPASVVSSGGPSLDATDIAVIGYSCRVPGGNNSPSQLWEFLLKKGDASSEIPEMRWEPYITRQPGNAEILSETTSKGYFLDRLEDFDASFFGISPREAEQIDPQQRIAVEVAWEALEHAGIAPQSLSGSDTAVFMGVNSDDYSRLLLEDLANVEAWMGVGTAFCGIPNRISYLLDLMGPSSAVDAACASSLVAIHHGRQALKARETSLVIAGGVNALVGPGLTRVLDKAGAISADGRCRSFDDSAAGYGRGEGAGVVILKRLEDAIEDEDRILAVLKGSAVGADGRTNGIMAPNQQAQERVARKALKEARLLADSISYIEAHATSTPVGDPTECAAMANVYGSGARRPGSEPCYIGSVKSNIGHLEAGAGVLGFIKAIMVVQNGLIPPQSHLATPTTKINWEECLLKAVTEPTPWLTNGTPRRAAIASYGYGGTVSHAIIEAAPVMQAPPTGRLFPKPRAPRTLTILLLSAPQISRIGAAATRLAEWLESSRSSQNEEVDLESVAYTLAVKRGHHKFRTAIIAKSLTEAVELLSALAQNKKSSQICTGRALSQDDTNGTVWVFSGHGAQWKEMGQTLVDEDSAFREILEQLEPVIQQQMSFSAIAALRSGDFESVDKVQILTYVMQVGIAAMLRSSGVVPRAIIGHSLGEVAASVIAGSLTLIEGAMLCCVRANLYRSVAGTGAMILVNLPAHQAARELKSKGNIFVAVDSSPSSCVLSGTPEAVNVFSERCKQNGHKVHQVKSDVAFHTPLLSHLVPSMRQALENALSPKSPQICLYSTSLDESRDTKLRDLDYWVDNMIKPVLLTSTIAAAAKDGYKAFLEISSHPIVTHSINETLLEAEVPDSIVIPTLIRNEDTRKSILTTLGKLHCIGDSVDFQNLLPGTWLHEVPRTAWEHQPHWRKVASSSASASASSKVTHDVNAHILLGGRTQLIGTNTVLWQTHLDPHVKPFPGRHPLHDTEIVPAAVLLNTFLSAVPGYSLRNVSLRVPVVVGLPRDIQVVLENDQMRLSSRLAELGIKDNGNSSWVVNTTCQVSLAKDLTAVEKMDITELRLRVSKSLSNSFTMSYLAKVGVTEMGFPWRVLEHWENENEMLAKVHADPEADPSTHWGSDSWASILDAATSISSTIFHADPLLRMPTAIDRVTVSTTPTPKICYIHVKKAVGEHATDIHILNEAGIVLGNIQNLRFAGIEGDPAAKKSANGLVHRIAWPPVQLAENPLPLRRILFVAKESPLVQGYQCQLLSIGIDSSIVAEPEEVGHVQEGSILILVAEHAQKAEDVYAISAKSCEKVLTLVKIITKSITQNKVFCITQNACKGYDYHSLSQAPLLGLARIIQSEEPEVFGGLIDVEDNAFPLQAIKYAQGVDIIRVEDSVARNARLRPFVTETTNTNGHKAFYVQPQGTYVITGGLGALGLEVAAFLAEKGAKRLVFVSRRKLPPRCLWNSQKSLEIERILSLEAMGVSVFTVSVDVTAPSASSQLRSALDGLSLPPVLGVVHAAGTLANETVLQTTTGRFNSVIAPKIIGAMALHETFPPKTLDFLVLFSSCGQLLGFPGQASYASGNAFLDVLATHRRALGDNTVSMLWTSWRGLGMAASTRYIDAELKARGVMDVTRDDAFLAWEQIFEYDADQAVILRMLPLQADSSLPHPILSDLHIRQQSAAARLLGVKGEAQAESMSEAEMQVFLTQRITKCVALTLSLAEDLIDPHVALSELGMDSVMTVELRVQLQLAIKVKVAPTLIWSCPTVAHLVQHFLAEKSHSAGK
ncbi:hypothetical protein MMC07_004780 [Pseudocyphellaria aurata]|nr:hypothetical protein [Pseudocyphellaria aurata]